MNWLKRKFTWIAKTVRRGQGGGTPHGARPQTLRRKVRCHLHGCQCRLVRVVPLAPHGQRGYYICKRGGSHVFAIDRDAAGAIAKASRRKLVFRAA